MLHDQSVNCYQKRGTWCTFCQQRINVYYIVLLKSDEWYLENSLRACNYRLEYLLLDDF